MSQNADCAFCGLPADWQMIDTSARRAWGADVVSLALGLCLPCRHDLGQDGIPAVATEPQRRVAAAYLNYRKDMGGEA